jgi:hypothetical protein
MTEHTAVFIVGEAQIRDDTAPVLVPSDERAWKIMEELEQGKKLLVKIHKARWPEHHNLVWAVMDRIGKAIGQPKELVMALIKIRTGRVDFLQLRNGKKVPIPQSTRFESMSQQEFQAFWDDAWVVITEEILLGLKQKQYEEILGIVAPAKVRAA